MKRLFLMLFLLCLSSLCAAQAPAAPTGYVSPYAWAGVGPNGFAYTNFDNSGNLNVTGGSGRLLQISGYVSAIAPVAVGTDGQWHYLNLDSSGNLKVAGVGGGGTPSSPVNSIQFNNAGAFGGDAALTWDNINKILSIGSGSGTAGAVGLTQGVSPALVSGTIQLLAPGTVTAYQMVLPSSAATGFLSCNLSGSVNTCSFAGASTVNYYTNTTGTGLGPTSFTPATTCTLCLLDSTASTGLTRLWIGYDAGGGFTTGHISPTKSNISIVSGSTTAGSVQTDDAISFYTAAGSYRGGIITNASGNVFYIGSGSGVNMALGAFGAISAYVNSQGIMTSIVGRGHGVQLNATSAITASVPVKVDTANANQVVVTTTTDTGSGLVLGVCANSPTAGTPCNVITTGEVSLVLGTGTCAIGNFVIVDTTTNGRVKCTGTYSAGTVIGVALAAQSSVGSAFNVLVGLR